MFQSRLFSNGSSICICQYLHLHTFASMLPSPAWPAGMPKEYSLVCVAMGFLGMLRTYPGMARLSSGDHELVPIVADISMLVDTFVIVTISPTEGLIILCTTVQAVT